VSGAPDSLTIGTGPPQVGSPEGNKIGSDCADTKETGPLRLLASGPTARDTRRVRTNDRIGEGGESRVM